MKKIIKDTFLTFSTNVFKLLSGLLVVMLIARLLGPEKKGAYTLIFLLPNIIFMFINLGIGPATVYFVSGNKYDLEEIINTNLFIMIFLSIIGIIGGYFFIVFLGDEFFSGISRSYLFIALSVIPLSLFNNYFISIFQGLENFKKYNYLIIIERALYMLLILILFVSPSLLTSIVIRVIVLLISCIILFYLIVKENEGVKIKFSINTLYIKECLSYSTKIYISNIIDFLNYKFDILLISYFLNPLAVGYYSISVSLSEKIWLVSSSASKVLFPKINSLKTNEEKKNITALISRIVLNISLFATIILFLISDVVIPFLFSKDYINSIIPLKILLIGVLALSFSRILANDLAGRGKPEYNAINSLISTVINIVFNIFMIPRFGIIGAAISTAISYSLLAILTTIVYCKISKNNLLDLLFLKRKDIKMVYRLVNNKKNDAP